MSALRWSCAVLLTCACAPKPPQEKVREPVSEKDRRDEAEAPVEVPPPAYGNRVVRNPREGADRRANERPQEPCQDSKRETVAADAPAPVTCGHSTTLVP